MCGAGHQTRLDALYDGHKTGTCREHDKRLEIGGGDVQSEWDRGDSGFVPEPVPATRFRSWNDAGPVAPVWLYERKLKMKILRTSIEGYVIVRFLTADP